MLMTGAFPEKNGVPGNCHVNNQNGIPDSLVCFTDVLAGAGYETAYVGKRIGIVRKPCLTRRIIM